MKGVFFRNINRLILASVFLAGFSFTVCADAKKKQPSKEPAATPKVIIPYEKYDGFKPINAIDRLVLAKQKQQGIKPANLCSDEVFVRRVYLDVIGTLPETWEVRNFLKNKNPRKRAWLIDSLLKRNEDFANYWALKWGDILRVKAEFPINLWPNAVQAYHRWIYDALKTNMPYDKFARELLTSSGSNFRVPQVNFYRAIQGKKTSTIASAVALTFMGRRYEKLSAEDQERLNNFFSRVGFKGTAEWKEEIVYLDPTPSPPIIVNFPNGTATIIPPEKDPRVVFADWLITEKNPWFAKNIVNRIWSWLMGRGIIHQPDDIRPGNPPSNPELLSYLEKELVKSNYDLKHIYRLILNSRTYQQSPIPRDKSPKATELFACYPIRQLDAEVLIDAIDKITGRGENYESPIPEPFTFVPAYNRSITLADGSITSQFLEMFGRPPRDSGYESERNREPSDSQRLYLLNSTSIRNKLTRSWKLRGIAKQRKWKPEKIVEQAYLYILSRYPTAEEKKTILNYYQTKRTGGWRGFQDITWALINSKEFLFRH